MDDTIARVSSMYRWRASSFVQRFRPNSIARRLVSEFEWPNMSSARGYHFRTDSWASAFDP